MESEGIRDMPETAPDRGASPDVPARSEAAPPVESPEVEASAPADTGVTQESLATSLREAVRRYRAAEENILSASGNVVDAAAELIRAADSVNDVMQACQGAGIAPANEGAEG